jgi:hypothetical protein
VPVRLAVDDEHNDTQLPPVIPDEALTVAPIEVVELRRVPADQAVFTPGSKPMVVEYIALEDLARIPAPYNPRAIDDAELDNLRRSLRFFGPVEPVVVNKRTTRVVGGHQRIKAALAEGYDAFPCVWVDLDEPSEKQLNLALNRISGRWDEEALALLLAQLEQEGADLEVTGFFEEERKLILQGWQSDFEMPDENTGNAPDELLAVFKVTTALSDGPEVFKALEEAVRPYDGTKLHRM